MRRSFATLLASLVVALALALALGITLAAFAAQQNQPQAPQPPEPAKANAETKKAKKVWTSEDLQGFEGKSGVSVVGNAAASSADKAQAQTSGYTRDPMWYRKQLAPLRAEVERLDKEITRTREFMAGGHTGEGQLKVNVFTVPMNPPDQIAQLEKRKREIRAKIDAIEEQARRNGVPPGELR